MARKIRMGMVGGGRDAFIGSVHRMAARLDGLIDLVCGAFSSSAEKSKASGKDLFLDESRCYGSFEELFAREKALPAGQRMDFVSIVTQNFMHFLVAKAATRRVGRTVGVVDIDVYDDQNRLTAVGRGCYGAQPG